MLPDATVIKHILASAGITAEVEETGLGVVAHVDSGAAAEALAALRASDADFRMLVDLFGADTGEQVEITYHLRSFSRDEELFVRTALPCDGCLRSVWNSYPSALAPERETAELLGLTLDGHPNPKRLLTTDGVEPLLRKAVSIRSVEEVRAR